MKTKIKNLIEQYEAMQEYYKREQLASFRKQDQLEVERYAFAWGVLNVVINDLSELLEEIKQDE